MSVSALLLAALLSPSAHAGDRVVGGHQAAIDAWPDAAGIVFDGSYVSCTGVLVAPDVVLTAAHCVDYSLSHVILGTNDYTEGGEILRVDRRVVHPDYNGYDGPDLALLILEEESTVEPRLMALGCALDDEHLYDGAEVAVVGYGTIDAYGNQGTTELREGFTTVTDVDCSATDRGCAENISPGGEIGAGHSGIDACYGDSGGPLYLLTDVGAFLVGLTSRAFWDVSVDCGEGGIWVRPDAFIDWIEEESGRTFPVPTCNQVPDPHLFGKAFDATGTLVVPAGATRKVKADGRDPEDLPVHVEIVVEPEHGKAWIDDKGKVRFTADKDHLGADEFVVAFTDEGVPSHTLEVTVPVEITNGFLGCGCQSSPAPSSLAWLGLVGLLGLRRRSG